MLQNLFFYYIFKRLKKLAPETLSINHLPTLKFYFDEIAL